MSSFQQFPDRNRDMQDGIERHVFGKLEWLDSGAIMKVRGNGTVDEEVILINIGQAMNLPENTNTEVIVLASGSDTNMKFALLTIPRDKQRPWKEGTGGIQHPTDPNRALEFNEKRTWLTDGNYAVGESGTIEVRDGKVYVRGDLVIGGDLEVTGNIRGPLPSGTGSPPPPFEE